MKKKSYTEMSRKEKRLHSLSAKTIRNTILSCIIFGIVAQVVALSFYMASLTGQYIRFANGIAHQAALSVTHGADSVGMTEDVLKIYRSLSPEERTQKEAGEYRRLFSEIDMSTGSSYDYLLHMLEGVLIYHDVDDVYIAALDEETSAIVYIVDSGINDPHQMFPGDWDPVDPKVFKRFINPEAVKVMHEESDEALHKFDWTKDDGLMCTVGVPIPDRSGEIGAFVMIDISIQSILYRTLQFSARIFLALLVVTALLAFLQTKHIQKSIVQPINRIEKASQNYAKDRSANVQNTMHFSALDIHTGDELEKLGNAMCAMEKELSEYEANLTKITAEKQRISTELSLATKIQASMLPHHFPPFPERNEFDIYAVMKPAREVGGDFYDFFLIDNDHLGLVMADVSGKGIPAALFMMISKTILQSCAMLGRSPADILAKTNDALCYNNQVDMFVTVWLGILEISTGKLTAANAGHEYPALMRADGSFELYKDKHGLVIGGMAGMHYKEYTSQFGRGDKLFLYTDGVPEATDADNNMFGTDRMLEALNREPDASPEQLLKNVRDAVKEFVRDAEQFDDLTMMGITYNKDPMQKP